LDKLGDCQLRLAFAIQANARHPSTPFFRKSARLALSRDYAGHWLIVPRNRRGFTPIGEINKLAKLFLRLSHRFVMLVWSSKMDIFAMVKPRPAHENRSLLLECNR